MADIFRSAKSVVRRANHHIADLKSQIRTTFTAEKPYTYFIERDSQTGKDAHIDELVKEYMSDRGISPPQMTPDQAHEVIDLIKKSPDPRIRSFVRMINTLHRFFRRFGGRGE